MVPTVLQEVMPTQSQTMEVPEFTSEMLHHQEAKVVLLHQLKRIVYGLEDASINPALVIQVMELFAQQWIQLQNATATSDLTTFHDVCIIIHPQMTPKVLATRMYKRSPRQPGRTTIGQVNGMFALISLLHLSVQRTWCQIGNGRDADGLWDQNLQLQKRDASISKKTW